MPPIGLTNAARDMKRLYAAVLVPDLFISLFCLACPLVLIAGHPLDSLGLLCAIFVLMTISYYMRRRSIVAILLAGVCMAWLILPLWLCGRAVFAAARVRRRFGPSRRHTAANRLHRPRTWREVLLLFLPALLFLLCGLAALPAFFLTRAGLPFAVFHWLTRRANAEGRRIREILSYRAQEIRAVDRRPVVLFLHSFQDDDLTLARVFSVHVRLLKVTLTLLSDLHRCRKEFSRVR